MKRTSLTFPIAQPRDHERVCEFFLTHLPHLPDAMSSLWPKTAVFERLSGVEMSETWLALAGDELVGVGMLQHVDKAQWHAFLLCDPAKSGQTLPGLHQVLNDAIYQFRYLIPAHRRIPMDLVLAIVPDSHHQERLANLYRKQGWQPYARQWNIELQPGDLNRIRLAEVQAEGEARGVTTRPLHSWSPQQRSAALHKLFGGQTRIPYSERSTWVALVDGKVAALNGPVSDSTSDQLLLFTWPLWLVRTPRDDLVLDVLTAALLGSQRGGPFVFSTQQDPAQFASWFQYPSAATGIGIDYFEFDFSQHARRLAARERLHRDMAK